MHNYVNKFLHAGHKVVYSTHYSLITAGSVQGVDAIITPALKAMMSKHVPPQEQGLL